MRASRPSWAVAVGACAQRLFNLWTVHNPCSVGGLDWRVRRLPSQASKTPNSWSHKRRRRQTDMESGSVSGASGTNGAHAHLALLPRSRWQRGSGLLANVGCAVL